MPYGLEYWANDDFIVKNGKVVLDHKSQPSLLEIVEQIRAKELTGPLLLRFPHLIEKQIDTIYNSFEASMKTFDYQGQFHALFPLKVNQFPEFLQALLQKGKKYNYGLEAGSKAELILAMSYNHNNTPITVNGFKDEEMIRLAFIAKKMNHDITITIEGLNELKTIIHIAKNENICPNIGIRIRLHNSGSGLWSKSGGINAKFGLSSSELIQAMHLLQESHLISNFSMIHFHIGSQMNDIAPLKKALKEAGHIYADLKKMGAFSLDSINLGGGLAVEYGQHKSSLDTNYSLLEFSNDIVYELQSISEKKGVKAPDIYTESGRFIAASSTVLIAPVLELFSSEYSENKLELKEDNPPLIIELLDLYQNINSQNAAEYMHDALDHMESLLTLFDLGYVDLLDRSNSEILVHLIIKKALLLNDGYLPERRDLQERIQERYLINFSLFQSLPDYWGLGQNFPVMPIHHLDKKPTRSATLWDITCDSDGEIPFNSDTPLYLHDIDLDKENYFLGFFLVGAYQEVLGMNHNLFAHPMEATIEIDDEGYAIHNLKSSKSLSDILDNIDYDINELQSLLKEKLDKSTLSLEEKTKLFGELFIYFSGNGYLKATRV
jgi:arginine decarboxylase